MVEGYFTEAASLMREGGLDPREVHSVVSIRLRCLFTVLGLRMYQDCVYSDTFLDSRHGWNGSSMINKQPLDLNPGPALRSGTLNLDHGHLAYEFGLKN